LDAGIAKYVAPHKDDGHSGTKPLNAQGPLRVIGLAADIGAVLAAGLVNLGQSTLNKGGGSTQQILSGQTMPTIVPVMLSNAFKKASTISLLLSDTKELFSLLPRQNQVAPPAEREVFPNSVEPVYWIFSALNTRNILIKNKKFLISKKLTQLFTIFFR
jgi:hypothetical protein